MTEREFRSGPLYMCPERHEVLVDGNPVTLTFKEFMLLQLLVENRGLVLTREILLERIWGLGAERENRTLDVHIRTLRAKLGNAGSLILFAGGQPVIAEVPGHPNAPVINGAAQASGAPTGCGSSATGPCRYRSTGRSTRTCPSTWN